MLENVKIVLIETSHSGNIGSAARAMKTMGLRDLCLVAPKQGVDEQAVALAAGAEDVLKEAEIVNDFDDAVADCTLVIGTSARLRHLSGSLIEPRECGEKIVEHLSGRNQPKTAVVFGRERVGLTNRELQKCRYHLTIPANPDYSSLNLAMAVQLICYEIRMAWLAAQNQQQKPISTIENNNPSAQELAYFYTHTERLYRQLGFIRNQAVMPKLRRLYNRAGIEKNELNILQGMLSAVERAISERKM